MSLKISRILHAGYVFESGGTSIAFDPIVENPFSRNCHAFPSVRFEPEQVRHLRLDAIFISHLHDDHLSLDSLDHFDRATPIYLYCVFDELFAMLRALGFAQVHRLQVDLPVQVGSIEIIPRRALDDDVDSLFQVRAGGLNVLNVVDSWIGPDTIAQLAQFAPWDMVLWPFQTMREIAVIAPSRAGTDAGPVELPDDWVPQLRALAPRYIVPSSCQFVQEDWSWYNHAMFPVTYRQFAQEIGAALPDAHILRLDPSTSVLLDGEGLTPAAPLPWVIPVGPQDVDFDYRPGLTPPATADIARRFAPLSGPDAALVLDFCRDGLLQRYRDMELAEDSYFQAPRLWRLSLYGHDGTVTMLHYRTHGDQIALVEQADEAPGWTTEVPLVKCHAALVLGESLTSMYMRINDHAFDAATQALLDEADIVDDPLIRCLFNDAIGAYQAAQLRRLLARPDEKPATR
ncbi:MBL fold metallo-hydrolase [Janthinobacterium sp. Mn2066]|uniref:MBL fold metallo-hydrolase n=1 Tax=Janthinobacterium sp. Mn2066 TaxID=3395264 RepID=UPI003BE588DC